MSESSSRSPTSRERILAEIAALLAGKPDTQALRTWALRSEGWFHRHHPELLERFRTVTGGSYPTPPPVIGVSSGDGSYGEMIAKIVRGRLEDAKALIEGLPPEDNVATEDREALLRRGSISCPECNKEATRVEDRFDLQRDRAEAVWRCPARHEHREPLKFDEWQKVSRDRWLADAGSRLELKQPIQCPTCGRKASGHYVSSGGLDVAEHFELQCSDAACSFRGYHAPRAIGATLKGRLRGHVLTAVILLMAAVGTVVAFINLENIRALFWPPATAPADAGTGSSGHEDAERTESETPSRADDETGAGSGSSSGGGSSTDDGAESEDSDEPEPARRRGRGGAPARSSFETRCVRTGAFPGRAQQSSPFSVGVCTGMRPGAPIAIAVSGNVSVPDRAIGASAQLELRALGATDSYSCNTDLVSGCNNGRFSLSVNGSAPADGMVRASIYPAECSSHGRPNVSTPASQCDFSNVVVLICDESVSGACDPP